MSTARLRTDVRPRVVDKDQRRVRPVENVAGPCSSGHATKRSGVSWWQAPSALCTAVVDRIIQAKPYGVENSQSSEATTARPKYQPVKFFAEEGDHASKSHSTEEEAPEEVQEDVHSREDHTQEPKPSEFEEFLNPVGYLETRLTRMMSSVSSIAYRMDRLTPAYLERMHGIKLRYTSLACEIGFDSEWKQEQDDADKLGDGMAASTEKVQQDASERNGPQYACKLAAARAYDQLWRQNPNNATNGPRGIEGYSVFRPQANNPGDLKPRYRKSQSSPQNTASNAPKSARNSRDSLVSDTDKHTEINQIGSEPLQSPSRSPLPTHQQIPSMHKENSAQFYDPVYLEADYHDEVLSDAPFLIPPETNTPQSYGSEPLLMGALVDRAQWWDAASEASDTEESYETTHSPSASPDGNPQSSSTPDPFCLLSRLWPGSTDPQDLAEASEPPPAAAQEELREIAQDPEDLSDFTSGMEGDIMQAAAIATQSLDCGDSEDLGYLENLRQRFVAMSTVKTVTYAAATSGAAPRVPKPDTRNSDGHSCPVHWFVADDPVTHTRIFSLQGSDSLESWKTNLSFDPVIFEDAKLGVSVHRGMYGAALALYDRFAPMVAEYLAQSPYARISLTGHSLGGSIATILAMIMVHRKLVRPIQLGVIYTFGAAAAFCEADTIERVASGQPPSNQNDEMVDTDGTPPLSHSTDSGLLRALGIPRDAVRNVIMTHDIVPRAFACDYTPVAAMLRRVFTEHSGLQNDDRSIMYHFVGRLLILQPSGQLSWIRDHEQFHPFLPRRPGLYELVEPDLLSRTRHLALRSLDALESVLEAKALRPSPAHSFRFAEAAFQPTGWLRRITGKAPSSDTPPCNAVNGYPSPCSHPTSATAEFGRHAFYQSLAPFRASAANSASPKPTGDAPPPPHLSASSAVSMDLQAVFGGDYAAMLRSLSDSILPSPCSQSSDDYDEQDTLCPAASNPEPRDLGAESPPSSRPLLHDAELAILDNPHPLTVLADPSAYGGSGAISRFHHPDNYTQALGSVMRTNLRPFRRIAHNVKLSQFTTLLRARLRRLRSDPVAEWHSAMWDIQAAAAAQGEWLHLKPSTPAFGAAVFKGIQLPGKLP